MRACNLRLVLVLLLIAWESGASFINQSQSKVKQNQSKRELRSTLNCKPLYEPSCIHYYKVCTVLSITNRYGYSYNSILFHREHEVPREISTRIRLTKMPQNFSRSEIWDIENEGYCCWDYYQCFREVYFFPLSPTPGWWKGKMGNGWVRICKYSHKQKH